MDDEIFNRIITVRFVIPFKIVVGAFIALWLGPIIRQEPYSVEVLTMMVEVITYSTVACMLYMIGDYVCYQSLRIGKAIYRKVKPSEDEST